MFKNREFRVRVAKIDNSIPEDVEPHIEITKEDVKDVTSHLIKTGALYIAGVIAAAAVAHTASEIIIHHSTKK